jgi:hypothetical protein
MADSWEVSFFGNITNRTGFEDDDGDGISNRDEFQEGTHPKGTSSGNPRLTIFSDFGEVFVSPNLPEFTNGQSITLTGVPDPGMQFIAYLGQPTAGGPFYSIRTNPAPLHFGAPGIIGSEVVRAIFGVPLPFALNVTNGWRIDMAGWYGQTNVTHDGVAAAQSARILGAVEALLELTNVVLKSEGTISFWWKVDGTDQDLLQFRRNNLIRAGAIGTNTDWQLRTYYLPAGTNVVRWEYVKHSDQVSEYNNMFYAPADAGWVDEVSYAPWPDPLLDTDGDGVPDIWEYKYFDSLAYNGNDDPDGDGISNLDEYLEHTDPTSNISLLPRLYVVASGGTVVRTPDQPKYTYGQTVQIQAVPDPTNYFVIWSGPVSGTNTTNSIILNGNKTVTALFGLPLSYALDTPTLTWTRNGPLGFYGETNVSYDGVAAAQSGPVGFHQESAMETSVTGPGTLIFWWKAFCATNVNYGRFLLDGVEQPGKISGTTAWQPQSYFLGSGAHTLRWNYTNNTAITSLTNGVWVDQVSFKQGSVAPTFVAQPSDLLVPEGDDPTFAVTVTGTPPFTYQWFRNNVSLGASATSSTLTVSNVTVAQAGSYHVEVSNSVQKVSSSAANLNVVPVPPVNDNFANRTTLTGTNAAFGYTFGATKEVSEPDHAFIFGGHSVWWSWTAPAAGNYRLSVIATNIGSPVVAAVYTGTSVDALTSVMNGSGQSFTVGNANVSVVSFAFTAVAGTTYALAVDDGGSTQGFLSLAVVPSTRPVFGTSSFVAGNSFGFDFAAPPGASYVIEASSDLQVWNLVASGIVPPSGIVTFTDPVVSGAGGRFYRIQLL